MKKKLFHEKYGLPQYIRVSITKTKEGAFFAKLPDYLGCITEAENILELIANITDAILTYFKVPRKEALKSNIVYLPPLVQKPSFLSQQKSFEELKAKFFYFTPLKEDYYGKHTGLR